MADVNILEMDLSPEDEKFLRESLTAWKEEITANLMEEVEELKEQKLQELEEVNVEYREKIKEEFASKMIDALKEMREDIRAEVVVEMYDENPELAILEQVKELIAPTLNEEYMGNVYTEEIQTLNERIAELEKDKNLDDGAKKLAELISPYSEKTQNILISLIKEGGPDEVTEQFYNLIENLEEAEDDEDEEDDDDEVEAEDDDDEEDEDEDEEDDDDEAEDDEDDEEESTEEDDELETYINEDEEGDEKKETVKRSKLIEDIVKNSKL